MLGRQHTKGKHSASGKATYDLHVCRELCSLHLDSSREAVQVRVLNRRVFVMRGSVGHADGCIEEYNAGTSIQVQPLLLTQTHNWPYRHTHANTPRQAHAHTQRQAGRQAGRQTHTY